MNELQGIKLVACKIVGATQLAPIFEYLKSSWPGRWRLN
jgi:hypothetical protein